MDVQQIQQVLLGLLMAVSFGETDRETAEGIAKLIEGTCYHSSNFSPLDTRADDLEIPIQACEQALQVYTREDFPFQWAMFQNSLALALKRRIRGDRADNLERSIHAYEQALQVYTREDFPVDWAIVQNRLAVVLEVRIRGDRADNLERSIHACEQALQVRTRKDFPVHWADTQHNLALTLRERIRGDRADNLERSIHACEQSLQVSTREEFPIDWAMTQDNLALALSERIRGDRADNLERSIHAYEQALQVRTREDFPVDWAKTQNNLANALRQRIRGDRSDNLERSIHACEQALQICTRENFPSQWATLQDNLANALSERILGDRADNLERSIHAYEQALQIYTREDLPVDWARVQQNLALTLRGRIRGDRADNLERSIHACEQVLQIYTRGDFPFQWAMIQNNLANALRERIRGDHADNIERSIEAYRSALEIYQPESFPVECLATGRNFGEIAFQEEQWELALEGYGAAMAAIEQSRSGSVTEERRQEVLSQSIVVYEDVIHCHIQRGNLSQALEVVERVRSRRLVELMGTGDLYQNGQVPETIREILRRLDTTQQQLQTATQKQLITTDPKRRRVAIQTTAEIATLETERTKLRNQLAQLDPIASGFREVQPLAFEDMLFLVENSKTALLSCYTTDNKTHIFILRKTGSELFTISDQGKEELTLWLGENWLLPYAERHTGEWLEQMPKVLAELSDRLQLNDLIEQYLTDITDLILIPHLLLHQIPFAALPLSETEVLGDRFTLRYAPGCQVLKICRDRQQKTTPAATPTYGIVENATNDLPCSAYEGQQLAKTFAVPRSRHLQGTDATVIAYRQLLENCTSVVSTHHAQHRLDNPLESHLLLGNGDRVTLGQLLLPTWRFPELDEVFLSCCETSFTFTRALVDDVLTLGTGFLCAGANSVIGTLWSVDDLATALFSLQYHHHRQTGSDRPTALRQAQNHLRQLTGEVFHTQYAPALKQHLEGEFNRLCDLLDQAEAEGDSDRAKALEGAAAKTEKILANLKEYGQRDYPFAQPFYWAGFTCQGLR